MKILSIVGARPQFVKIAPLERAFARCNGDASEAVEHLIVHTGQHYDVQMSGVFFKDLGIPEPTVNLEVGSGGHARQTGAMLEKIEAVLQDTHPDLVVTFGDTNSTLAGALAAAKLNTPVAHVEAGLRSFNRRMPEEINRLAADHICDLLLAPTPTAMKNLAREGLEDRAVQTGDIMYDAMLFSRGEAEQRAIILDRVGGEPGRYGVVTVHRAENTDDDRRLSSLLKTFNRIAETGLPLLFPIHPRTAKLLRMRFPDWTAHPRLRLIDPVGYLDMLSLVLHARVALTDSGGLQKEAFFLGCPCVTLREETEWVETVEAGANLVAGVSPDNILQAVATHERRYPRGKADFAETVEASFGDGHAADRIRDTLLAYGKSLGARRETRTLDDLSTTGRLASAHLPWVGKRVWGDAAVENCD